MTGLDVVDETMFLSPSEVEEMEVAMFGSDEREAWDWFASETHSDPMEWTHEPPSF